MSERPAKRFRALRACTPCRKGKTRCEPAFGQNGEDALRCHRCSILELPCDYQQWDSQQQTTSKETPYSEHSTDRTPADSLPTSVQHALEAGPVAHMSLARDVLTQTRFVAPASVFALLVAREPQARLEYLVQNSSPFFPEGLPGVLTKPSMPQTDLYASKEYTYREEAADTARLCIALEPATENHLRQIFTTCFWQSIPVLALLFSPKRLFAEATDAHERFLLATVYLVALPHSRNVAEQRSLRSLLRKFVSSMTRAALSEAVSKPHGTMRVITLYLVSKYLLVPFDALSMDPRPAFWDTSVEHDELLEQSAELQAHKVLRAAATASFMANDHLASARLRFVLETDETLLQDDGDLRLLLSTLASRSLLWTGLMQAENEHDLLEGLATPPFDIDLLAENETEDCGETLEMLACSQLNLPFFDRAKLARFAAQSRLYRMACRIKRRARSEEQEETPLKMMEQHQLTMASVDAWWKERDAQVDDMARQLLQHEGVGAKTSPDHWREHQKTLVQLDRESVRLALLLPRLWSLVSHVKETLGIGTSDLVDVVHLVQEDHVIGHLFKNVGLRLVQSASAVAEKSARLLSDTVRDALRPEMTFAHLDPHFVIWSVYGTMVYLEAPFWNLPLFVFDDATPGDIVAETLVNAIDRLSGLPLPGPDAAIALTSLWDQVRCSLRRRISFFRFHQRTGFDGTCSKLPTLHSFRTAGDQETPASPSSCAGSATSFQASSTAPSPLLPRMSSDPWLSSLPISSEISGDNNIERLIQDFLRDKKDD